MVAPGLRVHDTIVRKCRVVLREVDGGGGGGSSGGSSPAQDNRAPPAAAAGEGSGSASRTYDA
jgi:hypothetical protein